MLVVVLLATAALIVRQWRAQTACERLGNKSGPVCIAGTHRVLVRDECLCLPDLPIDYWP